MNARQICPICEHLNPPEVLICGDCNQDLRSAPLQDYLVFTGNTPKNRKNDLIFQLGLMKHKVKVSFDAIKYLIERKEFGRIPRIFNYYREQIERERSSVSYYLQLFSRKVFYPYFGLLFLDTQVYFALLKTYIYRLKLPDTPLVNELLKEGLRIVEDQNNKLMETISDIIEEIEDADEKEIAGYHWTFPPLPPTAVLFQKWKS